MTASRIIAIALVGLLIAAACSSERSERELAGRGVLGGTNTDILSVPLEDVHVDTFTGGSIPLSEIDEGRLLSLRNAIPPIDSPLYDPADAGDWLSDHSLVLGYVDAGGQAYAYPARILDLHEIVNDELAGQPVLITYCPLCRSGIVYDRVLDGRLLSFGNTSALYESDLVMYDRETLS